MDPLDYARQFVLDTTRKTIMQESERDQQRSAGPSDLGDPCDACLAAALRRKTLQPNQKPRDSGFSLKAWFGTAAHEKLEREQILPEEFRALEAKVYIHTIADYGDIYGHIDIQYLLMAIVGDYKTVDMAKLKKIRMEGPPIGHQKQIMMYGLGVEKSGREVKYVALIYIPRDSNNPDDIYVAVAPYQRDVAEASLARAEAIWARVQKGDNNFESHADCYVCKMVVIRMMGR